MKKIEKKYKRLLSVSILLLLYVIVHHQSVAKKNIQLKKQKVNVSKKQTLTASHLSTQLNLPLTVTTISQNYKVTIPVQTSDELLTISQHEISNLPNKISELRYDVKNKIVELILTKNKP